MIPRDRALGLARQYDWEAPYVGSWYRCVKVALMMGSSTTILHIPHRTRKSGVGSGAGEKEEQTRGEEEELELRRSPVFTPPLVDFIFLVGWGCATRNAEG